MRADGKIVKNEDHMYYLIPYFLCERNDASNTITVKIPYQPLHDYVTRKRKEENIQLSYLGVVIAALVRTINEYPFLNRFVVNKKIYQRNELVISMVVLRSEAGAQTTMSKMKFEGTENLLEVNEKLNKYVETNRQEDSNNLDKLMNVLLKMPWIIRLFTNVARWADKHGLLPKAVIDVSPFHATLGITNLASIRTNYIHHHIYNFGTTSMFIAMGNMEDVAKMKGGEVVLERQMPFGIVMDERIGNGHAYAQAFATLSKYLKNPELLEVNPAQKESEE